MTSLLSPPDAIIYLEASPEFVYNKINDRGRDIERSIELSYLESLNEHYRSTIDLLTNITAIFYVDRTRIDGPDGEVNIDSHEYKNLLHMCRIIFRQYEPQPSQWPAPVAKRQTIDDTYREFLIDTIPYVSAAMRS
jgi:deoxyadenosine/deoxycytidine kinase